MSTNPSWVIDDPAPVAQQVGGTHYDDMAIAPWDALEAWLTPEQFRGYLLGEGLVYLARYNAQAPGKGGVQDVMKARHCLDRLLKAIGDA